MTPPQPDHVPATPNTSMEPVIITGYQYGDYGHYIGTYRFEKNKDKDDIHIPPRTTLKPPPTEFQTDEEVHFDGTDWAIRKITLPWLPERAIPAENEGAEHGD